MLVVNNIRNQHQSFVAGYFVKHRNRGTNFPEQEAVSSPSLLATCFYLLVDFSRSIINACTFFSARIHFRSRVGTPPMTLVFRSLNRALEIWSWDRRTRMARGAWFLTIFGTFPNFLQGHVRHSDYINFVQHTISSCKIDHVWKFQLCTL